MAELSRDRARAAKLKLRRDAGKPLTDENRKWLDAYEARVTKSTIAKGKALPSASAYTPTSARVESAAPPPREQLALPSVVVHETQRLDDTTAADAFTWTPTTPPPADDAAPPSPGAPPPPAAGAPLVDDAAPAQGQGDPVAAAQLAALVTALTGIGIASAMELLTPDLPVPIWLRSIVESEKLHAKVLEEVAAATQRLAVKWNLQSVPLADELVVSGAIAGSVLAIVAAHRRSLETKRTPTTPAQTSPAPRADRGVGDVDPTAPVSGMPDALKGVWSS